MAYRLILCLLGLCLPLLLTAQEQQQQVEPAQEPPRVLTFEAYMEQVRTGHPLSRQANLQAEAGQAVLQKARGAFDPIVQSSIRAKEFDGSTYYRVGDAGLRVPTWFGLEFKSGYEQTRGVYFNPELRTPQEGLWYAGLSMPLGRGLMMDERRAALRQAELFRESTLAMRQLMLNDLLFEAGRAYWDWFRAYHALEVQREAFTLALERMEAVRAYARFGDRPFVDTLEADILMQTRALSMREAELHWLNAGLQLSVYLWAEGYIPLEPEEGTVPYGMQVFEDTQPSIELRLRIDSLLESHPVLDMGRLRLDQLDFSRRLVAERLKPELNVHYNALSRAFQGDILAEYSVNNYKWGLSFGIPLFLRGGRGELQEVKILIEQNRMALENQRAQLIYQARSQLNHWETSSEFLDRTIKMVGDYEALLNAERRLFEAGESSLFLVNARETAYIAAQLQWVDMLVQNRRAALGTLHGLGVLAAPPGP